MPKIDNGVVDLLVVDCAEQSLYCRLLYCTVGRFLRKIDCSGV